jgi:kynurenine formamidase
MSSVYFPRYDELPEVGSFRQKCGWNVFGQNDRLGRLNLLKSIDLRPRFAKLRSTNPISLNWKLEYPNPGILNRYPIKHNVIRVTDGWDDFLDGYFPQGSSQWDALCHCRHPEVGYYNGIESPDELSSGLHIRKELGIHNFARNGIAARFIFADVPYFFSQTNKSWSGMSGFQITKDLILEILEFEKVQPESGDILLIRTGWVDEYELLTESQRVNLANNKLVISGLKNSKDLISWLWDTAISGIAADNPTLEATPIDVNDVSKFMHYQLIPLLGFLIGELFDFSNLSKESIKKQKWDGILVSAPLNVFAGVGSPANSIAFI